MIGFVRRWARFWTFERSFSLLSVTLSIFVILLILFVVPSCVERYSTALFGSATPPSKGGR